MSAAAIGLTGAAVFSSWCPIADYQRDVFRVHIEAAQNVEREYAAALRVVASVYHVADIVHVSRDRRELAFVVAVVKYFQYLARHF